MTRDKLQKLIAELEEVKRDFQKERIALEKNKNADPKEKAILRTIEGGISALLRDYRLKEALYTIT